MNPQDLPASLLQKLVHLLERALLAVDLLDHLSSTLARLDVLLYNYTGAEPGYLHDAPLLRHGPCSAAEA